MSEFRFSPRPNRAGEIVWRPWGKEAFAEAQLAQRPVLLAISAVWCHWCHVMDETSYSDPTVIRLANERYVPVRVDNDQRPDVNRRYNMGGWPTTAFLTPEGEVITGGTYIPPDQMRQALTQVADLYRDRRSEIAQRVAEIRLHEAKHPAIGAGPLSWRIVEDVVARVSELYDPDYGGFGREPKFPHPHLLRLLLGEHRRGRTGVAAMLHKSLGAMASGGMYDQVEGGFFRYATTREWAMPHYEKMLEDNSDLLAVYAEAHRTFPDAGYGRVAQEVTRWMGAVLWREDRRLFAGSQDADEHYFAQGAAGRTGLARPYVDPTAYTSWNALAASAHVAAATALGVPEALARANAILGALRAQLWDDAVGTYHFDADAGRELPTLLADFAPLLAAELDLYETGAASSLERASTVAERLLLLRDPERGAFFDAPQRDEPGRVSRRDEPIEDNALAADGLLRLTTLAGEERWREAALGVLRAFANEYREWGQFAAPYARAVARALAEPLHVVVVGPDGDAAADALWRVALGSDDAAKVTERLDPRRHAERLRSLGYPSGEVAAYVCIGARCLEPIRYPADLAKELARARERFAAPVSSGGSG